MLGNARRLHCMDVQVRTFPVAALVALFTATGLWDQHVVEKPGEERGAGGRGGPQPVVVSFSVAALVASFVATGKWDAPTSVPRPHEQPPVAMQSLINHTHHTGGRGSTLLSCGDVESNPGPTTGKPPQAKGKAPRIDLAVPLPGPLAGIPRNIPILKCPISRDCIVLQASLEEHLNEAHRASLATHGDAAYAAWGMWRCNVCNWVSTRLHTCQGPTCLTLTEAERQHLHRLKIDPTYLGGDIVEALTPPRSQPPEMQRTPRRPRGGDVPTDRRNTVASSRRMAMLYCPFLECPNTQVAQSADALTKHLSRVHVTAGQPIPQDLLAQLRQTVCGPCAQLYPSTGSCTGCGVLPPLMGTSMDVDGGPVPGSSLQPEVPILGATDRVPLAPQGMQVTSLDGPAPATLSPTIDEVLQYSVSTVRHLPNAAIRPVAVLLEALIQDLVARPSWETAHRFFCFPKLVLRAGRGGKGKGAQTAVDIARRVRLFERGDIALLWSELQTATPARGQKTSRPTTRSQTTREEGTVDEQLPKAVVEAIRGLVQEGALSKAAKHLLSEGLADSSDPAIAEKLRNLHPLGTPVCLGDNYALPQHVASGLTEANAPDWARLIQEAVASFPPGSAPGPSGLRPCHLRDCMSKPGQASSLLLALTGLVAGAAEGRLPVGLAPIWCASNLIPLAKKDGGSAP